MIIKVISKVKLASPDTIPREFYEVFLPNFSCFINVDHQTKIILPVYIQQVNVELEFSGTHDKSS